jgi:hypothetical protein
MANAGFDASIYSLTYVPEKPLWAENKELWNFTLELAKALKEQYLLTFQFIKFKIKGQWHAKTETTETFQMLGTF